jgi:hypothetical protein
MHLEGPANREMHHRFITVPPPITHEPEQVVGLSGYLIIHAAFLGCLFETSKRKD